MVATVSVEYASVANALSGLNRQHRGAILLDFSALMSLTVAAPGAHFNYRGHAEQWFAAVIHAGHGCDVVFTTDNLSAYDVIIAPLYRVITPASAAHLTAFVTAGGTLIASPLCATVNEDHVALDHGHPPYLLQTLFGIERIEWSSLNGLAAPPKERLGEAYADWQVAHGVGVVPIIAEATPFSGTYACTTWCDHLRLREARVHARFAAGAPAAGLPAITSNPHGNGSAWYVAGVTDQRAMDELVAAVLLRTLPYTSHIASPSRLVEMIPLHTTHGPLMALLNHDHLAHVVTLPAGHDLLRNKTVEAGQVELPAYAVLLMALTEA